MPIPRAGSGSATEGFTLKRHVCRDNPGGRPTSGKSFPTTLSGKDTLLLAISGRWSAADQPHAGRRRALDWGVVNRVYPEPTPQRSAPI
jgi:hypothetical protein